MARVPIEDCLDHVANRFELVVAASQRARAIHNGSERMVACKNKEVVSSLREIAAGMILLQDKPEGRVRAPRKVVETLPEAPVLE